MVQELPMGVGSVSKVDGDSQVKFFILIIILQPTRRGRVTVGDGVSGRIDPACDPGVLIVVEFNSKSGVLGFLVVSTAFSVLLWMVVGLQQHPAGSPLGSVEPIRGPGGNIAMTL